MPEADRVGIADRLSRELAELDRESQLRSLEIPQSLDFSSNDYLGLAFDPRIKQAVIAALASSEAAASTGSRLLSGNSERWIALETDFARFAGTEAALYFTSGYLANVGLLSSLLGVEDTVFSDSANHASLIDGIRLSKARRVVFPHLDLEYLESALRDSDSAGGRFIVVESIFSMGGDLAPLEELSRLAERYDVELIVDEAHAVGVIGPLGRGAVAAAGLSGRVLATIFTCGKALASSGAFVCGSGTLRSYLINRARTFIFSTALPPYFAAHVRAGFELAARADAERARVLGLAQFLRAELQRLGLEVPAGTSPIVPVILGDNERAMRVAQRLRGAGFGVRAIRPPTVPQGTARLRLSVTARHTEKVLGELAAEIAASCRDEARRKSDGATSSARARN